MSKTNNQALQDKIKELEQEVKSTEELILKHNAKVQMFMEDSNKSLVNQNEQIGASQDIIMQIKEDMVSSPYYP